MRCPFGEEVGNPPSIVRCGKGFPGCACADEWFIDQAAQGGGPDERTEQTVEVLAWWEGYL